MLTALAIIVPHKNQTTKGSFCIIIHLHVHVELLKCYQGCSLCDQISCGLFSLTTETMSIAVCKTGLSDCTTFSKHHDFEES